MVELRQQAAHTATQAFRPSTRRNHSTMIRAFISFCLHFDLRYLDPEPDTIPIYIQFLTRTMTSPHSIQNYIAAISMLHHMANRPPPPKTFIITSMLRAIHLTIRHVPNQKLPLTSDMLNRICTLCDTLAATGRMLKAVFLLLFFTFARQSNVAPRSSTSFDPSRHLSPADIFFSPPGMVVLIKWSKTMQTGQHVLLPVPTIRHIHCPVRALRAMLTDHTPTRDYRNSPLFRHPQHQNLAVTTSYLAQALGTILTALQYPAHQYSLHSMRRGGASAAYHAGVNHARVKSHGTWSSDAFWQYVTSNTLSSEVPSALAQDFLQHT